MRRFARLFIALLLSPLWELNSNAYAADASDASSGELVPAAPEEGTRPPIRRWSLELPAMIPEGLGADLEYMSCSWLSLGAFYHLPTPFRVKTMIKSRKLVDRDGFIIRSPNIDMPFNVKLGPHQGMGLRIHPFTRPFFLMLAFESRVIEVDATIQSRLEIIDSQASMMTNTLFQAEASTRTKQSIFRPTLGYRWIFGESDYFFSLSSGWAQPLSAHSSVHTRVRVRNPEASNPGNMDASNLEEAQTQQEKVIYQKLITELEKIEHMGLPVLGISFGKFL